VYQNLDRCFFLFLPIRRLKILNKPPTRRANALILRILCIERQSHLTTMTIKIEREALLCVLSRPPSLLSSRRCGSTTISDDDEEFVLVDIPKSFPEYHFDKTLRRSPSEDDQSLCTLSTDSLSDSSLSIERRVSFSTPLVTREWTRPWTPKEEIRNLYYSTEDTQR
jgi:hypothetical protein